MQHDIGGVHQVRNITTSAEEAAARVQIVSADEIVQATAVGHIVRVVCSGEHQVDPGSYLRWKRGERQQNHVLSFPVAQMPGHYNQESVGSDAELLTNA